jgi:hypothetical protein
LPEFDAGEGNRQVSVRSNRDPTAERVAALGLPRRSQDFRGPGKAKSTEGTVAEPRKREGGVGAVRIRHRSRDCPTGSRSTPSIVKVRPQAAWAFSSDGQSARLITARSVVRSHKGPYPSSGRGGPRISPRRTGWLAGRNDSISSEEILTNGDVAQLGEHLLCKQGVASSNLVISMGLVSAGPRASSDAR